jgi:hypothetical protein
MISNERPSPYGYRPSHGHHSSHHHHYHSAPKPPSNEETLRTEKIQIERKTFILTLKENPRGRFLRITEDVGGRRDTIIIPATGLDDFKKVVEEMVNTSAETPLKPEGGEEQQPS